MLVATRPVPADAPGRFTGAVRRPIPRTLRLLRLRVAGILRRWMRWEFWPFWLAYVPVFFYILLLGLRYRCLTLFTASNPGIPQGGIAGESKSAILSHLAKIPNAIADTAVVSAAAEARVAMDRLDLAYPVVLKPDRGERGRGVAIVRSAEEIEHYFAQAPGRSILQRYIPGLEFGLYYVRYPSESHGRVTSITRKQFPAVTGDGRRTLWQLILEDERAACMASTYRRLSNTPMETVIPCGETHSLAELGSHCRGAIFLDGRDLWTPQLQSRVDQISRAHPGFHIGRYDVRAESEADLRAGRFRVIELNGVTAEPAHIYDPKVSVVQAYRAMFRQWHDAFAIGDANRKLGDRPAGLAALLRLLWQNPWP